MKQLTSEEHEEVNREEWETECVKRNDGMHCDCWYEDKPCCACGED